MKIQQLIKDLGIDVEIIQNKYYPSMVHLKYKGGEICAAPNEIHEEPNPNYTNEAGDTHPHAEIIRAKIKNFVNRFDTDEDFRKLMTEPL